MQKIFLSICIPTYKRANYLLKCIQSVIGYQYDDIEIIISDNNSPDNTSEVVNSFKDKRIRYNKNNHNIGSVANIVRVISLARGEFVYLLTDDDMMISGAIEIIKKFIKEYNPDFIKSDLIVYLEKSKQSYIYSYSKENITPNTLNDGNITNIINSSHIATSICFRKMALDLNYIDLTNNMYPTITIAGQLCLNSGYIAEPLAIHLWENELFWDGFENELDIIKTIQNIEAITVLEGKLDNNLIKKIIKSFLENSSLSRGEIEILKKESKINSFFNSEEVKEIVKIKTDKSNFVNKLLVKIINKIIKF